MNLLHQIDEWSLTYNPRWLVFLRVILGLCLFVKGISFLNNALSLQLLIANINFSYTFSWFAQVITWIHLLGGFLIIVGLFTRTACLVQLPIVLGAVIFVNAKKGIFAVDTDLNFSLIVLLLLLLFSMEAGGPLSVDNHFRKD